MKRLLFLFLLFWQCALQAYTPSIVFIHGFLLGKHHMAPIARSLQCTGFDFYFFSYPSRQDFIECHAANLNCFLQSIALAKPGAPIYFVTHSIGGLLLRAAINTPCYPEEGLMGRAVLLAPPNRGALLAREFKNNFLVKLGMGEKVGWQLMSYEPEDYRRCFGDFPPCLPVLVISGYKGIHPFFCGKPNDGLLAEEETCLDTFHYRESFCLSHGDLLKRKRVFNTTRNFLLGKTLENY